VIRILHSSQIFAAMTGRDGGADFQAVLMDFGSTREARVIVNSRAEAVQLQEDAEAHCSAPYRSVPGPLLRVCCAAAAAALLTIHASALRVGRREAMLPYSLEANASSGVLWLSHVPFIENVAPLGGTDSLFSSKLVGSCRAPELYDVPSHCVVDQRIDVWSLGESFVGFRV